MRHIGVSLAAFVALVGVVCIALTKSLLVTIVVMSAVGLGGVCLLRRMTRPPQVKVDQEE